MDVIRVLIPVLLRKVLALIMASELVGVRTALVITVSRTLRSSHLALLSWGALATGTVSETGPEHTPGAVQGAR